MPFPNIAPEGFSAMGVKPADVYDGEAVRAKLSQAATLADVSKEAVLFTCALFATHGKLPKDLVQQYCNEAQDSPIITLVEVEQPVFSKMPAPFDRILVAVDRHHWESCFRFMTAVGIKDTPKKIYYQALPHVVEIPDVLALEKVTMLPDKVPMVRVMVFGLDGNERQVVVRPAVRPPIDLPRVSIELAKQETKELAKRIFAGHPTPFGAGDFSALDFLGKREVLRA